MTQAVSFDSSHAGHVSPRVERLRRRYQSRVVVARIRLKDLATLPRSIQLGEPRTRRTWRPAVRLKNGGNHPRLANPRNGHRPGCCRPESVTDAVGHRDGRGCGWLRGYLRRRGADQVRPVAVIPLSDSDGQLVEASSYTPECETDAERT
jgi:hypothetical protein